VCSGRYLPKFRTNIMLPSSRYKNKLHGESFLKQEWRIFVLLANQLQRVFRLSFVTGGKLHRQQPEESQLVCGKTKNYKVPLSISTRTGLYGLHMSSIYSQFMSGSLHNRDQNTATYCLRGLLEPPQKLRESQTRFWNWERKDDGGTYHFVFSLSSYCKIF
jgi:hypothetical protein